MNLATHGNRLPDDLQLPPLAEVSSRNACVKPQAIDVEQSEEICHQGWCFTLHNCMLSEKGNVAIPTDTNHPDSPASPELLAS